MDRGHSVSVGCRPAGGFTWVEAWVGRQKVLIEIVEAVIELPISGDHTLILLPWVPHLLWGVYFSVVLNMSLQLGIQSIKLGTWVGKGGGSCGMVSPTVQVQSLKCACPIPVSTYHRPKHTHIGYSGTISLAPTALPLSAQTFLALS